MGTMAEKLVAKFMALQRLQSGLSLLFFQAPAEIRPTNNMMGEGGKAEDDYFLCGQPPDPPEHPD